MNSLKPKILGITGGIGSGKSVLSLIFKSLGYPVFNSDLAARRVLTENPNVVKKITDLFSKAVLDPTGVPDRKRLAELVFNDEEKLRSLNEIIHPAVARVFKEWLDRQEVEIVLRESALLFETGIYRESWKNVLVSCPEVIRIARVMKRDGLSAEEVKKRIDSQMSETEKETLADFIFINDDSAPLLPQVWDFLEKINYTAK